MILFLKDELDEGDIAAMVTWLKYHNTPQDQVRELMRKTCKMRASLIRTDKDKTVGQLLTEYPRLIDTDGMVCTVYGMSKDQMI